MSGEITITILGGSEESSSGGSGGSGGGKKEKSPAQLTLERIKKLMHPIQTGMGEVQNFLNDNLTGGQLAAIGIAAKVLKEAASTAYSVCLMEHNRYFSLKEDYIAQNKMNILQTQISTGKSLLSSIASGAISGGVAGLAGGPVGVAVGAIVGGIASTANTVFKMDTAKKQKIEQYNMQLNAVNAQTQFSTSRASLVNGGRGTEY